MSTGTATRAPTRVPLGTASGIASAAGGPARRPALRTVTPPAAAAAGAATGIIAFGSGDPSVVLQSSLTSAASITGVAGGSVTGSPAFDAVKGMRPGASGGALFAGSFLNTRIAGQLSVEIEKTFVSQPSPDQISGGIGGSEGYNHLADGWLSLLDLHAADGTSLGGVGLTGLAALGGGLFTSNFSGLGVHSAGKSAFVRITLSWNGTAGSLYVDGLLHNTLVLPPVHSIARSDIGAVAVGYGLPGIFRVQGYYLRNLVLSTQPVSMAPNPLLTKVVIYGDSFASQSNPGSIGSTHFDATSGLQLMRNMNNLGMPIGLLVLKDYPGQVLNRSPAPGQASFQIGANRFGGTADKLTDVVNANGDYVIIMGGTNDATGDAATRGSMAPGFAADLLSMCRALLNAPQTKGLIMQTIISAKGNRNYATPTYVSRVASVNTMIAALPGIWDARYPAERGKVKVVDTFGATGGEAAATNMVKGTLTGALDDLHPAAFASVISANLIASALQAFVSGQITVSSCVSVASGVTLTAPDNLTVQIGGSAACTGYGQYSVPSLVLNQPTLTVVLTGGFVPSIGQRFQIIAAGGISGNFATITLPALPAGRAWDTSSLYNTGTIAIVGAAPSPEKGSDGPFPLWGVAAVGASLIGIAGRRLRRQDRN